jgi:hypothetical protein
MQRGTSDYALHDRAVCISGGGGGNDVRKERRTSNLFFEVGLHILINLENLSSCFCVVPQ